MILGSLSTSTSASKNKKSPLRMSSKKEPCGILTLSESECVRWAATCRFYLIAHLVAQHAWPSKNTKELLFLQDN